MWQMWANEKNGHFYHPVVDKGLAKLYAGDRSLVQVEVQEDPTGTYFGWVDAEQGSGIPTMIWPNRSLFEMCFPSGSRAEVDLGKGRVAQMSINPI
jgi:hypothetical protein